MLVPFCKQQFAYKLQHSEFRRGPVPATWMVKLFASFPCRYLVTSKQPHRVSLLMEGLLGMEWPQDSPR